VADFKLEGGEEDIAFELWCLFRDLDDVRTFVREAWKEYAKGDLSLVTTGMLTETAFGIMRRANEEFVTAHSKYNSYAKVLDFLKGSGCVPQARLPKDVL